MAAPYLPAPDADFDTWLLNFTTLLTAAPATYGEGAPAAALVAAEYNNWHPAFLAAIDPGTRTPASIAAKDAARAQAETVVRPVAIRISLNESVTNENKIAIGVNVRSFPPTPVPPPTSQPALELVSATPLIHQLRYRDVLTPFTKAKPAGVFGMQLVRTIGTLPGVDPAQGSFVNLYTKSPFQTAFISGDVGKLATYWGRWQTRGSSAGVALVGPWSSALVAGII